MTDGDNDQRSYVLRVLAKTGWSQTDLARRAGLDPSTLSRFLSTGRSGHALRPLTLQRIAQVSGVAFASAVPIAIDASPFGFAEDEAVPVDLAGHETIASIVTLLASGEQAIDAWRMKGRALELAGYRPGDTLFVKLGGTPLKGDVVCAQVYDWTKNRAETVFRIFEPPYLLTATVDHTLFRPLSMDDESVVIKGIVLHSLRSRDS